MRLIIDEVREYNLPEETKIETSVGAVYKAQDLSLKRQVAVKCVRIEGSTPRERTQALEAAKQELRPLLLLEAECADVPRVYDTYYDEKQGMFYIVMQWINGQTLAKKSCGDGEFLRYMAALCSILSCLEKNRLSHKDLKPENIAVTSAGRVYLMDFNITLNTPNRTEGTLAYKAPEMTQDSHNVARDRVDIFAIGVMLYERFTGVLPLVGREYAKSKKWGAKPTNTWDLFQEPITKGPGLDPKLNEIIVKCMKWDPKERYASARELQRELYKVVGRYGK